MLESYPSFYWVMSRFVQPLQVIKEFSVHVTLPSGMDSLSDGYVFVAWRGMSESGEKAAQYFKVPEGNIAEFADLLKARVDAAQSK